MRPASILLLLGALGAGCAAPLQETEANEPGEPSEEQAEPPTETVRPPAGAGELERSEQTVHVAGQYETRTRAVPVMKSRTEWVQRCTYQPRMVTRYETQYEYQCRSVSVPETTYETQYDYSTHTSRTVPVTRYVSKQDCGSQPVTRPVMRSESQYVCNQQAENRMVTEYETRYEQVWVPPYERLVTTFSKTAVLIQSEPELVAAPRLRTP